MKDIGLSVIIPVYNEEESIKNTLKDLKNVMKDSKIKYEILVVDDGSTDNTAKMVKGDGINLIKHPQNMGYGAALKTGIRNAKGGLILITDADGTYPAKDIPKLIEYADKYDMVIGARTGKNVKIPLHRRPAKWLLSKLANFLSGTRIPDLNSGIRVFRKKDIENFFRIIPSGFSFTTTITLAYLVNNYSVGFVPIDYLKREGKSKIRPIRDSVNFFSLIIKTITYFNPLKIFIPISILIFIAALFIFLYSFFITGRLMDVTIIVLVVASIQIALFGLFADLIVKRG